MFRYCFSGIQSVGELFAGAVSGENEAVDGNGGRAQAVFGLFSGMFIGCLALAIAEMLDSIPIFARRISFRHGLGWAILGMAAGKLCGSLLYFATEFYRTVQ